MKTAFITGSNGGIGTALCREFRAAGYFVIAADRTPKACDCDCFIQHDVSLLHSHSEERENVSRQVREALGPNGLSVLINNAAVQILNRADDIAVKDWDETLQTNLVAPFLLTQIFLPLLESAKGSVVNITSVHARATKPGFVCYATSKAALEGLTRALAVDLGPRVRINAISPAATATPMLLAGFEGKPKEFEELAKKHPLERIAEPGEIARVALFLASPEAAFITGATLQVDGGISSRLHDPV